MSANLRFETITEASFADLRDIRLRALQEAPSAFGSTYAKEVRWSDSTWRQKAAAWSGPGAFGVLAQDGEDVCGIAGCRFVAEEPQKAQLLSVWIAPSHRGRGLAGRLVERVVDWAWRHGATSVVLTVTSNNGPAIGLYRRLGFVDTGRLLPYANDPKLHELVMERLLE